ncbi:hypothetical protein HDU76_000010 [Blyttiomyces sp. JEL0837]|nr:hypothetical protein HDU76_000010 [Blyttiomyces sp. JEL0837]
MKILSQRGFFDLIHQPNILTNFLFMSADDLRAGNGLVERWEMALRMLLDNGYKVRLPQLMDQCLPLDAVDIVKEGFGVATELQEDLNTRRSSSYDRPLAFLLKGGYLNATDASTVISVYLLGLLLKISHYEFERKTL